MPSPALGQYGRSRSAAAAIRQEASAADWNLTSSNAWRTRALRRRAIDSSSGSIASRSAGRRTDALFVDRDAEVLVQDRIELDLAAPPVVVVLLAFAAHEVPAIGDFATRAQDRDAALADDADAALGHVVEVMPAREPAACRTAL